MLRRAEKCFFNNNNIAILNNKVVVTISIHNVDKYVVIIQQNAI